MTDREKDLIEALAGTTKAALSIVPGLGQAIAGYDAYKRSSFDRNLLKMIKELQGKVDDIGKLFSSEWLKTEEGEQFLRKVFDMAMDDQLADKQELFVNALVNGINDDSISHLQKLKFVDMLQHLSCASLMVLAEIHKICIDDVRGPGRSTDTLKGFPIVDSTKMAEQLSSKFEPYLVISAISELESQGLFSRVGEWRRRPDGTYISGGGFDTAMSYTDFSARFVEFITLN